MANSPTLLIVASCTHTKRLPVPDALQFRRFVGSGPASVRAWRRALQMSPAPTTPAFEMYSGGFWSVVKHLPEVARRRGFAPRLMVASAGYGLVSAEAQLKPYSATFGRGPDCIAPVSQDSSERRLSVQGWWRALAQWGGPVGQRHPRHLEAYATANRSSSMLVIASPDYVMAMSEDLLGAAAALRYPERLVIVSSATGFPAELKTHLVPSVAALQPRLGGALGSLHARTAKDLLTGTRPHLDVGRLAAKYKRLAAEAAAPSRPRRLPRTDKEVRAFIRRAMVSHGQPACSTLLRSYRNGGSMCEQQRFRQLYDEVGRTW